MEELRGEAEAALSDDELAVWHAVKSLGSTVVRRIGVDLAAATGLSGTDYGVISRLADLGGGRLGQQALTESMQLTKGAMSHQLTRMAERGLVTRDQGTSGVTVVLTAQGRELLAQARPVHAEAVREHLIERLTPEERLVLLRVAGRYSDHDDEHEGHGDAHGDAAAAGDARSQQAGER
jgi:DNA-binding MarR family transcriptional regulator